MSDAYLLSFHLGPVQGFIATARRTQDWWIGSWLLSYLSRTAQQEARRTAGVTLVLPPELPPPADATLADTPNHFTARMVVTDPAKTGQAIEDAVRREWTGIADRVKKQIGTSVQVDERLWQRQTESFLEVYWAAVPDDGSPAARRLAQAALDARKRLRDFRPTAEPHQKCSLCGMRQELSGHVSVQQAREWWRRPIATPRGVMPIRPEGAERLCAICAIKRVALAAEAVPLRRDDGHFPSTSSIAAAPFKQRLLERGGASSELVAHLDRLQTCSFPAEVHEDCLPALAGTASPLAPPLRTRLLKTDGNLYYAETFTLPRIRADFSDVERAILQRGAAQEGLTPEELLELEPAYVPQQLQGVAAGLQALFRALRRTNPDEDIPPPVKYFAALKMDGDRMGTFLGQATEDQAQQLSRSLSRFAREGAHRVVEAHLGRLVYAGGDDALALLSLENALSCARQLQTEFKKAVGAVSPRQGMRAVTPSIGLVFAHYQAPLDGVLSSLGRAERSAKNEYGRDALCVHVLKRSGEEVRVGSHWQYPAAIPPGPAAPPTAGEWDGDAIQTVEQVVAAFREGIVTLKFAQELASEARGVAGDLAPVTAGARLAVLQRLAKRHSSKEKTAQTAALALAANLAAWAEAQGPDDLGPLGLERVGVWVLLARFIVNGGREAE
jgi:CRISPR-associated protein Cmr2